MDVGPPGLLRESQEPPFLRVQQVPPGILTPPPSPEDTHTYQHQGDNSLFELVSRLQGSRLDDQRCLMPPQGGGAGHSPHTPSRQRLEAILRGGGPFPQVSLPPEGGFWVDPGQCQGIVDTEGGPLQGELEDSPCRTYRAHFLQSEHFNFCGLDEVVGPVVLSVKYYSDSEGGGQGDGPAAPNHIRIILRLTSGTVHRLVARPLSPPSPLMLARLVCPALSLPSLQPVLCPRAAELLTNYDEHRVVNNFKFGLVFQQVGQVCEEQLFGNRGHTRALDRFLDMLGEKVALGQHQGYRGGLDTQFGQTGSHSVYTVVPGGKEVMFHVATMLPFSETDSQQLQRKRHIGNDIVSLVFQEGATPFSPDMVTSHFLHAYIVVQPEHQDPERYRVSVTARSDVPYFGPSLPNPPTFRRGPQFREWLLNKLINAETACYKAEKFSKLEQRTRSSLLANLVEELTSKTQEFLGSPGQGEGQAQTKDSSQGAGGLFKNVKKALASRTKSQAPPEGLSSSGKGIPKSKSSSSGLSGEELEVVRRAGAGHGAPRQGRAGKSDSGRGSVSSSTRGASPVSSTSSPDLATRLSSAQAGAHSESDTSSLNSMECTPGPQEQQQHHHQGHKGGKKRSSLPAFPGGGGSVSHPHHEAGGGEVLSGAVTMVTLEGNVVAGQLSKLQDEISKLKVDKLELLRQNVAAQREVKRLRERELQLQSDLTTASREINRLRVNMKAAGKGSAPGHASTSLAALSLRSPPSEDSLRDRQH